MADSGWKNKGGTANLTCKCGSWKDHWCKFSGKDWPRECSVEGCKNKAEVGGHLWKPSSGDDVIIVPLCKECNNSANKDTMTLKQGTTKVSANTVETCVETSYIKWETEPCGTYKPVPVV
jgi:hypothetical protein